MKRMVWFVLVLVLAVPLAFNASLSQMSAAQGAATPAATEPGLGTPPAPQTVKIKAADGLEIVGKYYPSVFSGRQSPAALLLHQNGGNKDEWILLIPALQTEGYSILAVDQRGFGDTGGTADWKLAEADVATMLAWLRSQPAIKGDQVAIIGASIGSNLALRGCSADKQCKVAVALSPGLDYFGVKTEDVLQNMGLRAFLLVAAQHDGTSISSVKKLASIASGNAMVRLYEDSGKHGAALLLYKDLIPTITLWLRTYNN